MFKKYEDAEAYISKIFGEIVPAEGKSENLAGELTRAISRVGYRYMNDGDHMGVGYGKETCNAAGRFIAEHTSEAVSETVYSAWGVYNDGDYKEKLDATVIAVANYIEENYDELINKETTDMFKSFNSDEDSDDTEEYEEDDYYEGDEFEEEEED